MNNKKIIFGILLFCAISFIAYTFANPLEKEEDEGKLVPGSNTVQNNNNKDNNTDDDDDSDLPIKIDDNEEDQTDPVELPNQNQNQRPNPTRPSGSGGSNNSSGSGNNGGGSSSGGNNSGNNGGNIPVPEVSVDSITLTAPKTILIGGEKINLGVDVKPGNATNKNITFTSTKESVATVDSNGVVTAEGIGETTITAMSNNGKTSSVVITVVDNIGSHVEVTSNSSNATITSVQNGNTIMLNGTLSKTTNNLYEGVALVKITVPDAYNKSLISNLRYGIEANALSIPQKKYSGIDKVKNIDGLSLGTAYVNAEIPFNKVIIDKKGKVTMYVDWLGNGRKIKYTFDFSGVSIN